MVASWFNMLDSGASGLGWGPGKGLSVVFLGKTLYSNSRCVSPPRYINVYLRVCWGLTLRWTSIPSRGP